MRAFLATLLAAAVIVAGSAVQEPPRTTVAELAVTGTTTDSLIVSGGAQFGSGNVALIGTDGRISGPLSSTNLDDLDGSNLRSQVELSGAFDLTGRTVVNRALNDTITRFRWIAVIAGEDDINGLGLGVVSVPLASIPVGDATPQDTLYGGGGTGTSLDNLYIIGTNGSATLVGSTGIGGNARIGTLAEYEDVLYYWERGDVSRLYRIDRLTGAAVSVGTDSIARTDNPSALAAVEEPQSYAPTGLKAWYDGRDSGEVMSCDINPGTGSADCPAGGYDGDVNAAGSIGNTIYLVQRANLYRLDGGGQVLVGGLGVTGINGMAGAGGTLYGTNESNTATELYSINTLTGAATLLGSNPLRIFSLAGFDLGVSPAVRLHVIPNVRVDVWRPTGTTDELSFYSESATHVLQVVGIP